MNVTGTPVVADQPVRVRRLALALAAGALACALSLAAVGLWRGGTAIGAVGVLAFGMYFVGALVVAALVGLPVLFVLRGARALNLWSVLLTGALAGAATGWAAAHGDSGGQDIWAWGIAGLLSAAASWVTWQAAAGRRQELAED